MERKSLKIVVLNTGSELLRGDTLNTHLSYFGESLAKIGLSIFEQRTLGDGEEMKQSFNYFLDNSDIILVTGGLGPTEDDLTRIYMAESLGVKTKFDEEKWREILAILKTRSNYVSENNKRQAFLIDSGEWLQNEVGIAPGIFIAHPNKRAKVFLLPGPPRELYRMFEVEVLERIKTIKADFEIINLDKSLDNLKVTFWGMRESLLDQKIKDIVLSISREIEYSLNVSYKQVRVFFQGKSKLLEEVLKAIKKELGDYLVSTEGKTYFQVVLDKIFLEQIKFSLAESCTGGTIAGKFTDVSGISKVFLGGITCYSNSSKRDFLDIPEKLLQEKGAVSFEVAKLLAKNCREKFGSDIAFSLTGIAGPSGGSKEKPVGTVFIGISKVGEEETRVKEFLFNVGREAFKERCFYAVLDEIIFFTRHFNS